jgi:hypothetical protein
MFSQMFGENAIQNIEVLTIIAIVVALLYAFKILNVFKKG